MQIIPHELIVLSAHSDWLARYFFISLRKRRKTKLLPVSHLLLETIGVSMCKWVLASELVEGNTDNTFFRINCF